MTTVVISTNSSSTFDFTSTIYQLIVSQTGNVAVASGDGIDTGFGGAIVVVEGSVSGQNGFYDNSGSGSDIINLTSSGLIVGLGDGVVVSGGNNYVSNIGLIESVAGEAVALGADNVINNQGKIAGFYYGIVDAGGDTIYNSGSISAEFSQDATIFESHGNNKIVNTGSITAPASYAIYFEGGDDVIRNSGDIVGEIYFSGDYNTYSGAHGTLDGLLHASGAHSAFIGGADGTTFAVSDVDMVKTMKIVGGGSADDAIDFSGTGKITALDLLNVSGIETFALTADETLTLTQNIANTAAGHQITVNLTGSNVANFAAIASAADSVAVWADGGKDAIIAGASTDTFGFSTVADSTGANFDVIAGANFTHDKFNIPGTVKAINAAVTAGSLSTATFDANLAADLGPTRLGAGDAVLFTASGGTLKGDTFLVVDMNGTAGYQAGQDLVVRLIGATGTLGVGNFI